MTPMAVRSNAPCGRSQRLPGPHETNSLEQQCHRTSAWPPKLWLISCQSPV